MTDDYYDWFKDEPQIEQKVPFTTASRSYNWTPGANFRPEYGGKCAGLHKTVKVPQDDSVDCYGD